MTLIGWLKFVGMPWVGLAIALATVAMVATQEPGTPDYGLAITSAVFTALYLVAPVVAGAAAWAGWRLTRSSASLRASVRGAGRIGGHVVVTLSGVALLEICLVALTKLVMAGADPFLDAKMLLAAAAVLVGWAWVGFALGVWLHAIIAVPLALAASYLCLVIPLTLEPLWIRQLTGVWDSCCQIHQEVWTRAFVAVLVLNCCLALASWTIVRGKWRGQSRSSALASLAFGIVGIIVASMLVDGKNVYAAQERTGTLMCTSQSPAVCVWPEHQDLLPTAQVEAARVATVLRESGISPLASTLTEAAVPGAGEARVTFVRDFTNQDFTNAAISAFSPVPSHTCEERISNLGPEGSELAFASYTARNVLEARMGLFTAPDLEGRDPQAILTQAILRRSVAEQNEWFHQTAGAIAACDPSLLPS